MTRLEAIRIACALTALAYRSLDDYSHPSDGFCDKCPAAEEERRYPGCRYQNAGHVFRWIRDAIILRLVADGHEVDPHALADVNRRLGEGGPHGTL